ncbi:MAG: family 43 glycosylhydrolase [Tepidisphaeraceae bacterium]
MRQTVGAWILFLLICVPIASAQPATQAAPSAAVVPSPIFNDPNYEGAADPEIVWNKATKEWWIFYTARRIMADTNPGCGGCPIGVAVSKNLIDWRFAGYCKFDGVGGEKDSATTLWAPGIICDSTGVYHMFLVWRPGAEGVWGSGDTRIRHYVAKGGDLLNGWTKVDDAIPPPDTIDAGLIHANDQYWMFYRDLPKKGEAPGSLYYATSPDLNAWTRHGHVTGPANDQKVNGASYQEAPYAFKWKGHYWLLTDQGSRLGQYYSEDLTNWTFGGPLLQNPGWRPLDKNSGKHPSVAVIGDRAFIFYFNHPYLPADQSELEKKKAGRSWLHMSELSVHDGRLECNRDELVTPPADVRPADVNAGRD